LLPGRSGFAAAPAAKKWFYFAGIRNIHRETDV
jgi:hypothetical protein